MELRQLRYFIAVAEELNFTKAAEKIHVAQPALSRQIRQLEEEIGTALFDRNKHGVALTAAGRSFLQEARTIFVQSERAVAAARSSGAGENETLNIGYVWGLFHSFVPRLIGKFRSSFPSVAVNLFDQTATEQARTLQAGKLDLGFIGFAQEAEAASLEKRSIGSCAFVAALPENHRTARRRTLRIEDLAEEFFFVISEANYPGAASFILQTCKSAGFRPKILQAAERGHTILSLVAGNCGVALLPETLRELPHPGVVLRPLSSAPRAELFVAWNKSKNSPPRDKFMEQWPAFYELS